MVLSLKHSCRHLLDLASFLGRIGKVAAVEVILVCKRIVPVGVGVAIDWAVAIIAHQLEVDGSRLVLADLQHGEREHVDQTFESSDEADHEEHCKNPNTEGPRLLLYELRHVVSNRASSPQPGLWVELLPLVRSLNHALVHLRQQGLLLSLLGNLPVEGVRLDVFLVLCQ